MRIRVGAQYRLRNGRETERMGYSGNENVPFAARLKGAQPDADLTMWHRDGSFFNDRQSGLDIVACIEPSYRELAAKNAQDVEEVAVWGEMYFDDPLVIAAAWSIYSYYRCGSCWIHPTLENLDHFKVWLRKTPYDRALDHVARGD